MRLRALVIPLTLAAAEIFLSAVQARAPLDLSILKRDGYGVVHITQPEPNELIVTGNINAHKVTLVLDTGCAAEGILLDSNYASGLGLPLQLVKGDYGISASGTRIDVTKGIVASLALGDLQISKMPIRVAKFAGLRNENLLVKPDGFIGVGFLHATSAVVDLQNMCLYVKSPGKGRRAILGPALRGVGMAEAPLMGDGRGVCLVDVAINGAPCKMIMDTGAGLTGADKRFAAQMKANGYNSELFGLDVAGTLRRQQRSRIESFKIGGTPVYAPELTMDEFSCYSRTGGKVVGLLGMDILGQNWSIIDFGQEKLYFASAK